MGRQKRWEESPIVNEYGEVRLYSWRYFFDFIHQEMSHYEKYFWRGQRRDDWPLESTFDRLAKKAEISKKERERFRTLHLKQFKYAARGRRGLNPPFLENENDWWALGQHHGLATPLLDWTTSPFVALYFAFIGVGNRQTKHRTVYALHSSSVSNKTGELFRKAKEEIESGRNSRLKRAFLEKSLRREVEFVRPLSDENPRLVNQGGLFTRAPDGRDLQSWVQENFTEEKTSYTLMKIYIPDNDRESCLRTLNRMNINHLTLFPDLYGASKFCNIFGEIDKY